MSVYQKYRQRHSLVTIQFQSISIRWTCSTRTVFFRRSIFAYSFNSFVRRQRTVTTAMRTISSMSWIIFLNIHIFSLTQIRILHNHIPYRSLDEPHRQLVHTATQKEVNYFSHNEHHQGHLSKLILPPVTPSLVQACQCITETNYACGEWNKNTYMFIPRKCRREMSFATSGCVCLGFIELNVCTLCTFDSTRVKVIHRAHGDAALLCILDLGRP